METLQDLLEILRDQRQLDDETRKRDKEEISARVTALEAKIEEQQLLHRKDIAELEARIDLIHQNQQEQGLKQVACAFEVKPPHLVPE